MIEITSLNTPHILKHISASINDGEFVSIIGQNGSGKTTFLKCLCGIVKNYTGNICLNSRDISEMSQKALSKQIAYVPQIVETTIPFTLMDFLIMSRYPVSVKNSLFVEKRLIEQTMSCLDILKFKDRIVSTLSGGEIQKALIASALVQETPVILLDEPTSHLDPARSLEIVDILKTIHSDHKKCFLMVSHKLDEVKALSDRVIAFKDGVIVLDTIIDQFDTDTVMDTVYQFQPNMEMML